MKMITESNFEVTTAINEDTKSMYVQGIYASANKKNKNGRIYPRSLLEREIDSLLKVIGTNSCIGELNHPISRSEVDLNESAIKIVDLKWDGDNVMGKAKVLSTPKGCLVRNLLDDGIRLGISSRGLGTVSEGYVNDDFKLLTFDLVNSPSNIGSWMNGILEGIEFNSSEDKQDEIKFLKEELEKYKHNYELLKEYVKSEAQLNWIEKILRKL